VLIETYLMDCARIDQIRTQAVKGDWSTLYSVVKGTYPAII